MGEVKLPTWSVIIFVGLVFLAGYGAHYILSRSQSETLIVDKPAPVQPVFVHDTITIVKRLDGSIGKTNPLPPTEEKPKVVVESQKESSSPNPPEVQQKPCPAFSLHLSSKPSGFSSCLDSISLDYFYPSGISNWLYWGATQKSLPPHWSQEPVLSYGISSSYRSYQSKIDALGYLALRFRRATVIGGYNLATGAHPSIFFALRKEWKIF